MTEVAAELVATAMDYPFSRPDHSYLFVDGEVQALRDPPAEGIDATLSQLSAAPLSERTAVLAYGANAAPERLRHKFAAELPGAVFPVVKARLFEFDVVYACPGTVAEIALTYLDGDQLAHMHETELSGGSYVYGSLEDIKVAPEGLATLDQVHSYWTGYGHYSGTSGPIALSAVTAEGRRFAEAAQVAMQTQALDRLAPDRDLHIFVRENVADPALRQQRSLALRADAKPFDHPHCQIQGG